MGWINLFEANTTVESDGFLLTLISLIVLLVSVGLVVYVIHKTYEVNKKMVNNKKKKNASKKNAPQGVSKGMLVCAIITTIALTACAFTLLMPQSAISQQLTEPFVPWEDKVHTCPACGWQGTTLQMDTDHEGFFAMGDEFYDCPECGYDCKDKDW